jgi:8-oxo-dGTP diphosphatase
MYPMINVTCAIIRNEENEILVVRRGENTDHPLKWEFPGGKINKGESEEECIIREIAEELSIDIVICSRLIPVEHDYGNKQVRLIPFICDTLDETPVLSEHVEYKWLAGNELQSVDFSEADVHVAKQYIDSHWANEETEHNNIIANEETNSTDADLQDLIKRMMSRQEAEWVANLASENHVVFKKLLDYSINGDKKLAFRSSWTLSKVCDKYPELIDPFISDIIIRLKDIDNESVQRSFLRIISLKDMNSIDKKYHGVLADYCFAKLNSGFSAIAIKAYSMEIIYNLTTIYPELANELVPAIQMLTEDGSAGIYARGKLIMKKINKL